jgi:hypothetical protein
MSEVKRALKEVMSVACGINPDIKYSDSQVDNMSDEEAEKHYKGIIDSFVAEADAEQMEEMRRLTREMKRMRKEDEFDRYVRKTAQVTV